MSGQGDPQFVEAESPGRVWVLQRHDAPPFEPLQRSLAGYEETERIDATGISAVLYERP